MVPEVLIYILFTIILIPLIWWYYALFKFRTLHKIQGPKPWPFIGNAIDMGNNPCELMERLMKYTKIYGSIYKIFVGPTVKVVVTDPDLIETITQSNIHISKSHSYDLLRPWINDGLLVSAGSKWKARRKLITPSFHFTILERFLQIFDKNSTTLVENMRNGIGKPSVDLVPLLNHFTLDVICETSMGQEVNSQKNQNSAYVQSVRQYLEILMIRWFSSWKQSPLLYRFSNEYKSFTNSLKVLKDFSNKVIKTREQTFQYNAETTEQDDIGKRKKVALLDMLLEQKINNHLTQEDIREEIDTFIFVGHDTVTASSSFALYELALHPHIQKKLYEEITKELPPNNEPITGQQLNNLKYLDMVVKESLRMYPAAPFVERQLYEDFTIGDQTFPAGTGFNMFIYGMHHSNEYFPEPEKFDPERFSFENIEKRHKFAYLPFSAGPRNCIGQRYAQNEMKLIIVRVLQNFELLPVPGFKLKMAAAATLQSYSGVSVQIISRSK